MGYDSPLGRFVILTLLFCGGIELMQAGLPTRHARISDFVIDFMASVLAMAIARGGKRALGLTIDRAP